MVAAYSIDLRNKIVKVYEKGNISYSKVAKRFYVSVITVKRYVKQYRKYGNLLPKKGNKGRPSKIDKIGYEAIQKIIRAQPTITLAELSELYYKKRKVKAGRSILSRACLKLNFRRKKLSHYAAERERDDVKKNGRNTLR